jgi:hypothetical protein
MDIAEPRRPNLTKKSGLVVEVSNLSIREDLKPWTSDPPKTEEQGVKAGKLVLNINTNFTDL